jgi:hypothetical protein
MDWMTMTAGDELGSDRREGIAACREHASIGIGLTISSARERRLTTGTSERA